MSYTTLGATTALTFQAVRAIQTSINSVLVPQGYAPITVDGIIGPKTCGALQATVQYDGGTVMQSVLTQTGKSDLSTLCKTYTPPVLTGKATPVPTPAVSPVVAQPNQVIDLDQPQPGVTNLPSQSSAPAPSSSLTSPKNLMIAGGVIVGGVLLVYAHKKSKKKAAASSA